MTTRRDFLKTCMYGTAGLAVAGIGMPMPAFAKVLGSNDRIRVGVIGFSDRFRQSLLPSFMACAEELNFEIVAVSDIWKLRREEAVKHFATRSLRRQRPGWLTFHVISTMVIFPNLPDCM